MSINISDRRKELGLTLADIAKTVGVSKSTVKKWESGYIKNMRRDKVLLLASALKIDPLDLLDIKENPTEKNSFDNTFYLPITDEIKAFLAKTFPKVNKDACVLYFNNDAIYCINSPDICKKIFSFIASSKQ